MSGQVITGTKAADKISVGDESHTIDAGDGNNVVTTGNGDNTIDAGLGNDKVTVGDGNNAVQVGDGTNRVVVGNGDNEIQSGKGNDQITLGRGSNVVTSTGGNNRITGSDGNTQITTGSGKDDIRLGHGDNRVAAGDGANRVTAGDGANHVETGSGADRITLGDGDNQIAAGAGKNQIIAGDGQNEISSGDGDDKITVGNAANEIDAGNGRNTIKAGASDNQITTGKDSDSILVGDGNNTIDVGDGTNRVVAGDGNNTIRSGSGKDDLRIGDGNNQISAGDGDNKISAGDGDNTIEAGTGRDTVLVGRGANDISVGDGDNKVTVGAGNNTITSGSGKDDIRTGHGNNTISAGEGNNKIQVGNGFNQIETGSGADSIRVGQSDNQINAGDGKNTISAGDGYNQIEAGSGDDRITAGDGENSITAGEGRNRIQAGDGDNQIHSGSGSDDIRLGDGANDVWSEGGDNKISSGDGNNVIVTHDGKDSIKVGNGFNEIDAGEGQNRIDAGKGENHITTGDGNDTIRVKGRENTIEAGGGKNAITAGDGDTQVTTGDGNDTIKLGDGQNWIRDEGGDNRISVGDGTVLIETDDGKDDIRVGDGHAEISTSNGDKKISGGDGTMSVFTGSGRNTITLGDGHNTVYTGDGNQRITIGDGYGDILVGDGNNTIRTGDSHNAISAGDGNNKISTGDGYNDIATGDGKDDIRIGDGGGEIRAGGGNDKIRTGDGNAEIRGEEGDDTIQTGDGDDKIWGGQGDDQISAGDGYDIVYYAGSYSDYSLDLSSSRKTITSVNTGISDAGSDRLTGVEAIYFQGDGTLLDLTWEGDPTLVDDRVSAQGDDPLVISLSTLLENDEGLGDRLPVFTVSEYSTSGIRVTYDGEDITYNADDVLQYLAEGELFEDSFTYSVIDPYGEVFEAVVNVSLTGERDGPTANDDLLIDDTVPAFTVELGERVVVNQGIQGRQVNQSAVTLKDGGYLVAWYSGGYYDPDVSVEDRPAAGVWVRSFNKNGVPTSHDINVSQVPVSNANGHDIAVLENGNYVLTWLTADETVGAQGEVRPWCVKARVFEADGTPVTNEFRVSEEWSDKWYHVNHQDVVELENGGFVVTWRISDYTSTGRLDTPMASVFDNEGQLVREQFALAENPELLSGASSMVALPDGGFAIVQAYGTDVNYRYDINVDFYDDTGVLTSTYAVIDNVSEAVDNYSPTVKVGPNGEILVSWYRIDYSDSENSGYYATIINADGTEAVGEFRLDQPSDRFHTPDTTWLDDGRFVVTWNTSTASQIDEVRAQVFNPDGSENSPVFTVYEDANGMGPTAPSVTVLDDNRIVVTWYQERFVETGIRYTDILSRVVDVSGEISSQDYTSEDSPVIIDIGNLLANDIDPEGGELTFALDTGISQYGATVTYDAETGSLTYDPTGAAEIQAMSGTETLTDTFTYTITNGHGDTDQATVSIVVGGEDGIELLAQDDVLDTGWETLDDFEGGDEFTINSEGARWHDLPSAAATGNGGAIVVWDSWSYIPGEPSKVIGTIVGPDGEEIVSEFQITSSDDIAFRPVVSSFADGSFIVAWETRDHTNAVENENGVVKARAFNADGSPSGEEFIVADKLGDYGGLHPEIVTLENGNFVVTWLSDTGGVGAVPEQVQAGVFDTSGNAISEIFVLSDDTGGRGAAAQISALPDGGFIATWTKLGHIKARIFDEQGNEIVSEFQINSENLTGSDYISSVSVNEDGGFVIVWKHRDGIGNDGDSFLHATIFDADGEVEISEFEITEVEGPAHFAMYNQVEYLPNGQFVVVWNNSPSATSSYTDIYARIYNADGSPDTDQFLVNEFTLESQHAPDIVVLDDDSFMITWESMDGTRSSDSNISGRIYNLSGQPIEDYYTTEDSAVDIDIQQLLGNDLNSDSDTLIFSLDQSTSEHGAALSFDAQTGQLFYDPTMADTLQAMNQGETLEDTFIYTIINELGETDQATVTIVVGGMDETTSLASDPPLTPPVIDDIWG